MILRRWIKSSKSFDIITLYKDTKWEGGKINTKVKVIKASNTGARNRNSLDLDLKLVAAYCRVSTDSKDQLESYKSQVDYYTNLIKNNKNWTLAGIYADESTTGTTATKWAKF